MDSTMDMGSGSTSQPSSQELTFGIIQQRADTLYDHALGICHRLGEMNAHMLPAVPEGKAFSDIARGTDEESTAKRPALDSLNRRLLETEAALEKTKMLLARLERAFDIERSTEKDEQPHVLHY